MVKWVRSGVMEGTPELVNELGGAYDALAHEAGVPLRPMANPDLPIHAAGFVKFLELAALQLHEPAFGLRLGQRQTLSLFGPLALLLNSAATVSEMLHDLADYFPLHTQGAIVGLMNEGSDTLLTYELAAQTGSQQRQIIELGFSVMVRELRRHVPQWMPRAVYMRHAPPADRTWHRRLLGLNCVFNADCNALVFDRASLAMPTIAGNRAIHQLLSARYCVVARSASGNNTVRTEALVRAMLPFTPIELGIAARLLCYSRRTLQRRLASEGTTFEEIVDSVRAGLTRSYLCESTLLVAEIAELLQYSQTSALSRAVHRWYGMSPRSLRAQNFN